MKLLRNTGMRVAMCLTIGLSIFAVVGPATDAYAATAVVTNCNDSGAGSLRQAVLDSASGDTITFAMAPACSLITLTTGSIDILHEDLTISGPGPSVLAVSGNHASTVFNTGGGTMTISGLTIENGNAGSPTGGGIAVNTGSMTVINSVVTGNTNGLKGGGIDSSSGGASLTVINSTISDNTGVGGAGIDAGPGGLTVIGSTFVGNIAANSSAGVIHSAGLVNVQNSTFIGNTGCFAGALYDNQGTAQVSSSTFSDNTAKCSAGGSAIFNSDGDSAVTTVSGSIFDSETCAGAITDGGFNLDTGNSCVTSTANSSSIDTASGLDPAGLQPNGGPTQTIALTPGSAAINLVNDATLCSTADQRGVTRPTPACDAGAFEASIVAPVACAPGYFSATGNAPCTAAPAGYYVDSTSATSTSACSPGSYQPDSGQTSCVLAAKGFYVDSAGATSQTVCPSGSTTTATGASACVLVNQAPSFTKGPDQVVLANSPAQTVSPWATAISPGPASESGQRLDFIVTNDNNPLFSAQPSVDVDGTLHFTVAASQTGVATVSAQLRDDGGTAAGGVDTSAVQQFTITVNQAPSFAPDTSPPLTASVGQPYGYPFVATGYPATITYTLVGAPTWLTIDANGVVGGTPPTGTKTFTYSAKATNAAGNGTAGPYTVTVTAAPPASSKADVSTTLSCPASAKIAVNTTCTLTVRNAGPAVAKNVWVALALPSSLTRVSNTGTAVWWRTIATWKIASLNANATSSFTITFKARAAGKATIGTATASTSPDPYWKNNITATTITLTR